MAPQRNRAQGRSPIRTGGLNHWSPEEIAALDAGLAQIITTLPGRTAKAVVKKLAQRVEALTDQGAV